MSDFPEDAPAANPVFFRTYSRHTETGERETWIEVCDRTVGGIQTLGNLTDEEAELIHRMQVELKTLTSGRWLWIGGTEWLEKPENYPGAYNCTSTNIEDWKAFGLLMDLAMMGCGTGAVLSPEYLTELPLIRNRLNVTIRCEIGSIPPESRLQETVLIVGDTIVIHVGDSRQGWVKSYQLLLEMASDMGLSETLEIVVDLSNIRSAGEPLKGFGGIANPVKLSELYQRCASILNGAIGRQLNSIECCLLLDEAASTVVAGNIRRSAGIRQFESGDKLGAKAKENLWQQDEHGNWNIDPERDALRMANHTRVFHCKPTLKECIDAVREQYYSGEGAIQWAGEAVARANIDLLITPELKHQFLRSYEAGNSKSWVREKYPQIPEKEIDHRIARFGLNPCGEIIGSDFFCNLSEVHLNRLDPFDPKEQFDAFTAAALSVSVLLNHNFNEPRYQYSRELDPIVGVSFTGLFDFFVHAFGVEWLQWWEGGRPGTDQGKAFKQREEEYLDFWLGTVNAAVWDYCDRHSLKRPNRCTTVQPAGTKSLLTGASPGWHPPKSQRFTRRITFGKNDPVALACIDYGYNVIPSQSDKDESGNLLTDPFDERCTEWLVEIPVAVSWADLPGVDKIDISKFSALAQFDFYMQVQKFYVRHNTSATIEFRENEIEELGNRIYEAIRDDEGYISAALLARFDALETFPRLPFEPINKETYERMVAEVLDRREVSVFKEALSHYDSGYIVTSGVTPCDSDKCLFPEILDKSL